MPDERPSPLTRASRIGPMPSTAENLTGRAASARQERALDESASVFDSPWTKAKRALTSVGESIVDPGNWDRTATLPLEAITMVTKKPLMELLKRLHPRTTAGQMLDPQEFPNIVQGAQELIERFPRTASHLQSIGTGLRGARGETIIPNRITKQIQTHGPQAMRDQPVAHIGLNEQLIEPSGAYETMAHEFGHVGQFLADPTRWSPRYDLYQDAVGYGLNPYELGARFTGSNQVARRAGGMAPMVPSPTSRDSATAALRALEDASTNQRQARQVMFRPGGTAIQGPAAREMASATERAVAGLRGLSR